MKGLLLLSIYSSRAETRYTIFSIASCLEAGSRVVQAGLGFSYVAEVDFEFLTLLHPPLSSADVGCHTWFHAVVGD